MFRSCVVSTMCLVLSSSLLAAGPGQPDPSYWGDGWAELNWGPGTRTLAVAEQWWGTGSRFVVAGHTGGTTVSVTRFNGDGSVDTSFGFLGTASFTVPGAASGLEVRKVLLTWDLHTVVVGDASFGGNREVFLARLTPNGTLLTTFGNNGILVTTFGVSNANTGAWASDAVLEYPGSFANGWIQVVGWLDHHVFNRDLGAYGAFDLASGNLIGTHIGSMPTTGERWLSIGPNAGRCGIILGERDGTTIVRSSWDFLPGCADDPHNVSFPVSLPALPGAVVQPRGITLMNEPTQPDLDVAIAVWVESGLATQPTAIIGYTLAGSRVSGWGDNGVAYIDATTPGYNGFDLAGLVSEWPDATGIIVVGTELGAGTSLDRVRVARIMPTDGSLDPRYPTAGVLGPDASRNHRTQDAAVLLESGSRVLTAVTTENPLDFTPRGFLMVNCANACIFDDGFESGATNAWSGTVP